MMKKKWRGYDIIHTVKINDKKRNGDRKMCTELRINNVCRRKITLDWSFMIH